MKKSNLLIVLLLVLVSGAIWLMERKQNTKSSLEVSPEVFQLKDTSSLTKIFITDLNKNQITIDKTKSGWRVNDKYFADKKVLANVIEPLTRLRIKGIVASKDRQAIITDLATNHKKIEIYENNKLSRVWFLGSATQDGMGSYIYQEGMESPYIVHIPGWNGNIGPRFFVRESEWRTKKVFRTPPKNIASLEVYYPQEENSSFKVEVDLQGQVILKKMYETQKEIQEVNMDLVKRLLFNLGEMYFESYILRPRNGQLDSIFTIDPTIAQINLKSFKGKEETLVIKNRPLDNSSFNPKDTALTFDSDRFNAYLLGNENETLARLQIQLAQKILIPYDRFQLTK